MKLLRIRHFRRFQFRKRLLEIAKAYGIEGYDGSCTSSSIESVDFDGMEGHMSNVANPKEPSGLVPDEALENVLKLYCRTFFTFWTKSILFDWVSDEWAFSWVSNLVISKISGHFRHHHSRLTHGGYVKILVNLERLMNGVCKMKVSYSKSSKSWTINGNFQGEIHSVTESMTSTITRRLFVGEGRKLIQFDNNGKCRE